jgi:hypothetical protein
MPVSAAQAGQRLGPTEDRSMAGDRQQAAPTDILAGDVSQPAEK